MSFTDGKQWIATEKDCKTSWNGGKNGKYFRCYLCGHQFKPGDKVRWQYSNNIPGAGGNPLVCDKCDGTPEYVISKWRKMHEEYKEMKDKFWVFFSKHD